MLKPPNIADLPARLLMWLSALIGLAMMLHISADVIARVVFNSPFDGTIEIVSAYYMVAIIFLPLGYVTRYEGHIVVELFTRGLKPPSLARLDIFAGIITIIYMIAFGWMTTLSAIDQTEVGELWASGDGFIAVWPSRWFLPIGCFLTAAYLGIRVIQNFRRARHNA